MKYLLIFLLIAVILLSAVAAFLAGRLTSPSPVAVPVAPSPTPVPVTSASPSPSPVPSPSKIVSGGGILSFPRYELSVSSDWQITRETPNPDAEKVILVKDGFELSITQGGFGGSICLFPGDADTEGPSARYTNFQELTTKSGDRLRRTWTDQSTGFGICQLTQYGWNAPTLYGHIAFKTPKNAPASTIAEMDAILSSLTKK